MNIANPTPEELSKWITEKVMGECWHEVVVMVEQGHTLYLCGKCGIQTRSLNIDINLFKYASDLNLVMQAVEKAVGPGFKLELTRWSTGPTFTALLIAPSKCYHSGSVETAAYAIAMCLWNALEEGK